MVEEIYLGRQPILNKGQETVAYELLYRSSQENRFIEIDPAKATSSVIYNLFYGMGMDEVIGGKKAFINFSKELLLSDLASNLVPEKVVIEVLETVQVDDEVVNACKLLKKQGFWLALDDFIFQKRIDELLDIADIVKVDWMVTPNDKRKDLTDSLRKWNVKLLAEKVETKADFEEAIELGYELFQGYFFSRPSILQSKDIKPAKWTYLNLIKQMQSPDLEIVQIADTIKKDPAITYKLFKLINSAAFSFTKKISSVEQAIILMGEREIRRWLTLIILADICSGKPEELMVMACTRAMFGENVARKLHRDEDAPKIFLMGMLSLMNSMMDRPLKEIISNIPLDKNISSALMEGKGLFVPFLAMMLAYERANDDVLNKVSRRLNISLEEITMAYIDALQKANKIMGVIS